jgi:hypothetical protein
VFSFFFSFFLSYSHVDYGGVLLDRFPAAVRTMAARCKLPLALRPGLSRDGRYRTKEITKERTKESAAPPLYSFSAVAMNAGVGRNRGSSTSAPSSSASALLSSSLSLLSRSSHSDVSLSASSSSAGAGTHLHTSVVARTSSTALLHLSSASRSRTFQRLFPLPVSFLTSAQSVFCCPSHSAHSLKR